MTKEHAERRKSENLKRVKTKKIDFFVSFCKIQYSFIAECYFLTDKLFS